MAGCRSGGKRTWGRGSLSARISKRTHGRTCRRLGNCDRPGVPSVAPALGSTRSGSPLAEHHRWNGADSGVNGGNAGMAGTPNRSAGFIPWVCLAILTSSTFLNIQRGFFTKRTQIPLIWGRDCLIIIIALPSHGRESARESQELPGPKAPPKKFAGNGSTRQPATHNALGGLYLIGKPENWRGARDWKSWFPCGSVTRRGGLPVFTWLNSIFYKIIRGAHFSKLNRATLR